MAARAATNARGLDDAPPSCATTVTDPARFAPELVLAVVFGLAGGVLWARMARLGILLGIVTATSLTVIVALTLSPAGPFPDVGFVPGFCETRQWGPGSFEDLTTIGEPSLNVVLFVPLGVSVAFHRGSIRLLTLVASALLPIAIELAQLKLPALGRYCDSMDIADNELGLLLGLGAGAILAWFAHLAQMLARRESAAAPD
jgi:hypothetical protein